MLANEMKDILTLLFKNLNSENINYAVLRGYENLPEVVNNDIDFGVDPEHVNMFFEIVEATLAIFALKEIHYLRKDVFYQKYYYCTETNLHLHIDVWCAFTYKGLYYLDFNSTLKSHIYHKNIKVLNNTSEVSLSFLKEFLHMGRLRKDKAPLMQSKLSNSNNGLAPIKNYFNIKSHNFLVKCIQDNKFNLSCHRKKALRSLFIANIRKHGFLCLKNILKYYKFEIKNLLSPKGKFVCLIGPDGSGKTTCYNSIKKDIVFIRYNKLIYFHSRFGVIPRLKDLFRIKRKKEIDYSEINDDRRNASQKVYSKGRTFIYMSYYFWDFIIGHIIIRYHKYKNNLVVFDRYYFDYFFQTSFKKYPKIFLHIFQLMLPIPDLILILKAKPENIFDRKPELPIKEIKLQYSKIDKLFLKNINTYKIDTNSPQDRMKKTLIKTLISSEKA